MKKVVNMDTYLMDKQIDQEADNLIAAAALEAFAAITQEINAVLIMLAEYTGEDKSPTQLLKNSVNSLIVEEPEKAETLKRLLNNHSGNLKRLADLVNKECEQAAFDDETRKKASDIIGAISEKEKDRKHIIDKYLDVVLK